MDIYIELMRTTISDYKNILIGEEVVSSTQLVRKTKIHDFITSLKKAPKPENELFSVEYWDFGTFYSGRGFMFNPYALEQENRLIVTPILKAYSLKTQFENVLKADGYAITENKDEAQMIIKTQNLYYGNTKNVKKILPFIAKAINDSNYQEKKKIDDAKNTESLGNQISMASSMGNNNVAGALSGVAALDFTAKLLSGSGETDGYFISHISVRRTEKEDISIPNYMRLSSYGEVVHQTLCVPETMAFKSAQMFRTSIQNKLDEEKKLQ